jgi:dynein light intermediate chain
LVRVRDEFRMFKLAL